jgi:hypothetical protein
MVMPPHNSHGPYGTCSSNLFPCSLPSMNHHRVVEEFWLTFTDRKGVTKVLRFVSRSSCTLAFELLGTPREALKHPLRGVNIDMNTTTKLQVDRCVFICSLAKQSLQKQVEVACLFELSSFILSLLVLLCTSCAQFRCNLAAGLRRTLRARLWRGVKYRYEHNN